MSAFGTRFTDRGITKLLDHLGEDVTYTPLGGAGITRKAIYVELVGAMDEKNQAVFTISSNATTGVVTPERGDTITLGGTVWTVLDVRQDQAGSHELRCSAPVIRN